MKTVVEPKLGEGIYLVKDVSKILRLDYPKTYRWIVGYWGSLDNSLDVDINYTFGGANKAINFYSLIEFYTFFKLREKGVSTAKIRDLHKTLSSEWKTKYPFAKAQDFYVDKGAVTRKKFIYYQSLNNLIKHDHKNQASFSFVQNFLDKIEFDDNNLAMRFFPLDDSRNVVVDPNHQFGQPIVTGTNIKTSTLTTHFLGGDDVNLISKIYDLTVGQVEDAITFDLQKAA